VISIAQQTARSGTLPRFTGVIDGHHRILSDAWDGLRLLIDDRIASRYENGYNYRPGGFSARPGGFDDGANRRRQLHDGPEHIPSTDIVRRQPMPATTFVSRRRHCGEFVRIFGCGRPGHGPGQSIYGRTRISTG